MLRKQVLSTYRNFQRLTKFLPESDREFTRKWIRQDYDAHKDISEPVFWINQDRIKTHLQYANQQLRILEQNLTISKANLK